MFDIANLSKTFTLHHNQNTEIKVLSDVSFFVESGECVALVGPSGSGKSTLMRMLYGNYLATCGKIKIDNVNIVNADPQLITELRRTSLGYVSQFLRVLPRVATLRIVAEPAVRAGVELVEAEARAADLLARLKIPEKLWKLSPLTFSGGEQQRVNIARGFVYQYPALLLDEPTASLDAENRESVLKLIEEAKARGAAIIGIFHDEFARKRLCNREINTSTFSLKTK